MSDYRVVVQLPPPQPQYQQQRDGNMAIVGAGTKTASGDYTLQAASGLIKVLSNLQMAAGEAITALAGSGYVDLSAMTGGFTGPQGVTALGPGNVNVSGVMSLTALGTALSVTHDVSVGGALGVTGLISADGGIDRSTNADLHIASTNANTLFLSRVGQLTHVQGDFRVDGVETIVGITTFDQSVTFDQDTTFGTVSTSSVTFVSRIATDINFRDSVNHTIAIDVAAGAGTGGASLVVTAAPGAAGDATHAGGLGGSVSLQGQVGGVASSAHIGGDGGTATVIAGFGGAGTATQAAGNGAIAYVLGGNAGAANGGAGANGGGVVVDAGTATGSNTNGIVYVANTNASALNLGHGNIPIGVTGAITQSGGAFSFTGNANSLLKTTVGTVTLDGANGLVLKGNGTPALDVNAAGTLVTIQTGTLLNATGSGNIDLPNNGSAQFQIEGVSVSTNVTAPNLGTLTAGSSSRADALHTHALQNLYVESLTTTGTATGDVVYLSSIGTVSKTDNTNVAKSGFYGVRTALAGEVQFQGIVLVNMVSSLTVNVDDRLYLAGGANAGKLTNVAPTGNVEPVGVITDTSAYGGSTQVLMLIQRDPLITNVSANRALVMGGTIQGIADGTALVVGAGIISSTGDVTLAAASGNIKPLSNIQLQAGVTLSSATGTTGNIDLPNNANARFQIEGAAVTATVTTVALDTVTAGSTSNADTYHTHTNVDPENTYRHSLTITGLAAADAGYMSGTLTLSKVIASAGTSSRLYGVVAADGLRVVTSGPVMVKFETGLGSPTAGSPVYISATTAGAFTTIAPTSPNFQADVGTIEDPSSYGTNQQMLVFIFRAAPPVQRS